jgi:Ca2+-binding RTX toxin-like protein
MTPAMRSHGRLGLVAVLAASVTLLATPASGTFVCKNLSGEVQVHMQAAFDKVRLFLDSSNDLMLDVDGTNHDCGKTGDTTFLGVRVNGSSGADDVAIDIRPAGTQWPHNTYHAIQLGAGNDVLRVLGGTGADRVYANTLTSGGNAFQVVDTNGDGQPNVDLFSVNRIVINGQGGADQLGVRGSGYVGTQGFTLSASKLPLTLNGGGGNDDLSGGNKADVGNGGGGNDDLSGGKEDDILRGQEGDDDLDGDGGTDTCIGGPGSDTTTQCEN